MLTDIYTLKNGVVSLQGRPVTLKCKFCTSVSLNEVVILQQKVVNIFCNISFIFVHNTMFTVQKKCCCVMWTFYNISKLCNAMFHCSANALSSMLQVPAFYLIHKFAHTLVSRWCCAKYCKSVSKHVNIFISVNTFHVMCHTFPFQNLHLPHVSAFCEVY